VSRCRIQVSVFVLAGSLLGATMTRAQEDSQPPEHHHAETTGSDPQLGSDPARDPAKWSWSTDANVIFGYNYQERLFADFWAWESQNWMMLSGERPIGGGRLTLMGMFSLEPFTMAAIGSPQVFQTGESYQRSPLINYQHPHDLFMALGAAYRFQTGPLAYTLAADVVGAPALGPTPFMHRESARDNPSVPLTHHYMDSTHITAGVLTAGVAAGPVMIETSTFRGEEPDEDRLNIDRPRLDSWSVRGSWRSGPWSAQVSGGRLHQPEWFEPVDVIRLTASVAFEGTVASRPLAATAAWGRNRDVGLFALDGYLAEWDLRLSPANTVYGRGESMLKEIFGLGVHPAGLLNHPRNFSQIDALTIGYVRDIPTISWSRLGIGADLTVYRTSHDLVEYYGSPKSYHLFLRWRPTKTAPAHIH
jgi:hypothetical protein